MARSAQYRYACRMLRYCVLVLLLSMLVLGCDRPPGAGGLERRECNELMRRVDRLKNADMGTTNDVARNRRVDRCMDEGTRQWADCIKFAETASAVNDCDRLL